MHAQEKPLTKITFSLDFIPLGRHAPWYAAIAEGYYKDEGLDVSIIPSQGTAQTIQAVEAGTAQIGFTDVPSLVLARANGAKLKMVAVNYEKAPYAIFSLSTGRQRDQGEAAGRPDAGQRRGQLHAEGDRRVHDAARARSEKADDQSTSRRRRARPRCSPARCPAIEFFVMSKPGLEAAAKAKGAELRTFLLADHGLKLYSNGVVATEEYLAKNADVVKRFVRASLKGWQFALHNPRRRRKTKSSSCRASIRQTAVAEIGVVKDLAVTPGDEKERPRLVRSCRDEGEPRLHREICRRRRPVRRQRPTSTRRASCRRTPIKP